MKQFISSTLIFLLTSSLCVAHEGHHEEHHQEQTLTPIAGESIFNLESQWINQDGVSVSLRTLRGRPAVLAMVYTSCEHACPLIVEDMKRIEKALLEKNKVPFSFLLFSFDPARDTPKKLKAFATTRKLDPKRWTLFHGDAKSVRELAAVLGVRYKKDAAGDFDHSNVITLIDADGMIRHQQIGLNQDPAELLEKAFPLKEK